MFDISDVFPKNFSCTVLKCAIDNRRIMVAEKSGKGVKRRDFVDANRLCAI